MSGLRVNLKSGGWVQLEMDVEWEKLTGEEDAFITNLIAKLANYGRAAAVQGEPE